MDEVHVYSKCGRRPVGAPTGAFVHEVANVGRCDHTYAHHITLRYGQLPDRVIFLKDSSYEAREDGGGLAPSLMARPIRELLSGEFACGTRPLRVTK